MKVNYKSLIAGALIAPFVMTSCIEETEPTNSVTQDQLGASSTAIEAAIGGIPSYMKKYHVWTSEAWDFGYPAQMLIRDFLTQDAFQPYNGYQHFWQGQQISLGLDSGYSFCQVTWYYYNLQVKAANDVVAAINPEGASDYMLNGLAQALAYRASTYLDMARYYEFLPNATTSGIVSEGHDVTNLTVPITDPTNPDIVADNNPRATRQQMFDFILKDLDNAAAYMQKAGIGRSNKTLPDLGVVYGLKARLYMWVEDYPKAAEFARLAINTSGATPLTRDEWFDPVNGFNTLSTPAWMWGLQMVKEDAAIGYSCWTSFVASEAKIGYAGKHKLWLTIDKSLYESIPDNDWRKLSWVAPADNPLSGQEVYSHPETFKGSIDPYASLKFRTGNADVSDFNVCMATAIPLMRVEEMYLIEAEATAHTNPTAGKQLLETFMKTYRYADYRCNATDTEGVVDQCFLQKRIELWGEGQTFFDVKRLNKSVTRDYPGTNWPDLCRFNTVGRPDWMNLPICDYEGDFNAGFRGYNNPDIGRQ